MTKIIVAVDESQGSRDAIALARTLAGVTGATLTFANVFPYDLQPSRGANGEFEEYLRQDSRELLERLRDAYGNASVKLEAIANASAPHGLHELAEREDADLIVVGSTHTGRAGRVLPGSTAERLLHGAPCPVAVAPKGYADRPAQPTVIGCGYDGSPSSRRALEEAGRLAAATGAQLRVIRVFEPLLLRPPAGQRGVQWDDLVQRLAPGARRRGAGGRGRAGRGRGAEATLETGNAAQVLADASDALDLLFVGSRGYGPLRAVMVGGVSGRLVREAFCPVVVFPRSAGEDGRAAVRDGGSRAGRPEARRDLGREVGVAQAAPNPAERDQPEDGGQAELEDAVGEYRRGRRGGGRAIDDEHPDQPALRAAEAAGRRDERTHLAQRVGEDERRDRRALAPEGLEGGGEGGDREAEVAAQPPMTSGSRARNSTKLSCTPSRSSAPSRLAQRVANPWPSVGGPAGSRASIATVATATSASAAGSHVRPTPCRPRGSRGRPRCRRPRSRRSSPRS